MDNQIEDEDKKESTFNTEHTSTAVAIGRARVSAVGTAKAGWAWIYEEQQSK